MFPKTKLALAVALGLGAASAVQANETGYRVDRQVHHPPYYSMRDGGGAYALVPERGPARHNPNGRFERNWMDFQNCPTTEGGGC